MRKLNGHRTLLTVVLLVFLSFSLGGCFYLVLGGVAAAGGYAISQDTIQGEREKDFDDVWSAAVDIVSILGTINSQSHELGKMIALVSGAKVTINVVQLTPSTVRLKVKARKALFPSITTAQNIYIKIMNRVDE